MPGLGTKTVDRLIAARRHRSIRSEDLARLRLPLAKLLPFLVTADHRAAAAGQRRPARPGGAADRLAAKPVQLALL